MARSVNPEQTAPIEAVCSGHTPFACILKFASNVRQFCIRRLQQTTFTDAFFLALSGLMDLALWANEI